MTRHSVVNPNRKAQEMSDYEHDPLDTFIAPHHAHGEVHLIIVDGPHPYLWVGDADDNYLGSLDGEDLRRLRDRLTRALRIEARAAVA